MKDINRQHKELDDKHKPHFNGRKLTIEEEIEVLDNTCGTCKHYFDDEYEKNCKRCKKVEKAMKAKSQLTHKQLCLLAARFVEQHLYHCKEYPWRILIEPGFRSELPDVFAFTRYNSVLFECKASRADFLRDRKKPFRINPQLGIGEIRYYLVNEGVAKEEEMPDGWYLFEAIDENTVRVPVGFTRFGIKGQIDIGAEHNIKFQIRNASAEIDLMWSWEYRKKHNCLPEIPITRVNIIKREK